MDLARLVESQAVTVETTHREEVSVSVLGMTLNSQSTGIVSRSCVIYPTLYDVCIHKGPLIILQGFALNLDL